MKRLQILLVPDKENKNAIPQAPIVGFCNWRDFKDYLVRAVLSKIDNVAGYESHGEGTREWCDYIIKTNISQEKHVEKYLKLKVDPLIVTQKNFFTFWSVKYDRKAKPKFQLQFNNYNSEYKSFRQVKQNAQQKRFHTHYVHDCYRSIDDPYWSIYLKNVKRTKIYKKEKVFS